MTRPATEAFEALNDAMTRVMALESGITEGTTLPEVDKAVEQIDYHLDQAVGAWADLVILGVIEDFAAFVATAQREGDA